MEDQVIPREVQLRLREKVKRSIRKHGKSGCMNFFFVPPEISTAPPVSKKLSTRLHAIHVDWKPSCIGGHAIAAGGYKWASSVLNSPYHIIASHLLGVHENCFFTDLWPDKLKLRLRLAEEAGNSTEYVEVVLEALDYFIEKADRYTEHIQK